MSNCYEVIRVNEHCIRIEESGVRCFLFTGRERALLVDTGFGSGNLREVVAAHTDLPVTLVNTHTDRDHIGCNGQFGPSLLHPAEYDRLQYGSSEPLSAQPLWEGDVIDLGGLRFEVILIPGHTPGSIALLDEAHRVLVAGDSVQTGDIFLFGPGRNLPAYIASMQKLLAIRTRFDVVYPSHGAFPVEPGILDGLIAGAQSILDGKAQGAPGERHGHPITVYDVGVCTMLCP